MQLLRTNVAFIQEYSSWYSCSKTRNPEEFTGGAYSPRGGYSHIHAIWVCAAVKGMVFKLFSLG